MTRYDTTTLSKLFRNVRYFDSLEMSGFLGFKLSLVDLSWLSEPGLKELLVGALPGMIRLRANNGGSSFFRFFPGRGLFGSLVQHMNIWSGEKVKRFSISLSPHCSITKTASGACFTSELPSTNPGGGARFSSLGPLGTNLSRELPFGRFFPLPFSRHPVPACRIRLR